MSTKLEFGNIKHLILIEKTYLREMRAKLHDLIHSFGYYIFRFGFNGYENMLDHIRDDISIQKQKIINLRLESLGKLNE